MKEIVLTNKIKFGIPIIIQNKGNENFDKNEQLSTYEIINSPNLRKFNDKFIYMFWMQNSSMFSRFNWIKKTSMAKAFCEIVSMNMQL